MTCVPVEHGPRSSIVTDSRLGSVDSLTRFAGGLWRAVAVRPCDENSDGHEPPSARERAVVLPWRWIECSLASCAPPDVAVSAMRRWAMIQPPPRPIDSPLCFRENVIRSACPRRDNRAARGAPACRHLRAAGRCCASSTTATGWNGGFRSCAHWLHWRTGIALGAAREKVRVAHALASAPARQRDHGTRRDLLRQGAGDHPGGHARQRSPRCWISRKPAPPPTSNGLSAPGDGLTMRPRRRRPNRGICIGSCPPGWTTTAWS